MTEIYKSFTHGPIPLSFTARRLMQNLRFAIMGAIARGEYSDPRNEVAFARGELAKHISQLEAKGNVEPCLYARKTVEPPDWLVQEHMDMYRRLNELEAKLNAPKPKRKVAKKNQVKQRKSR